MKRLIHLAVPAAAIGALYFISSKRGEGELPSFVKLTATCSGHKDLYPGQGTTVTVGYTYQLSTPVNLGFMIYGNDIVHGGVSVTKSGLGSDTIDVQYVVPPNEAPGDYDIKIEVVDTDTGEVYDAFTCPAMITVLPMYNVAIDSISV